MTTPAEFVEQNQDLLLQTINAAIAKGKETAAAEMKKLTGGMGLPPGMGL